eukprot:TRINITY_DN31075_c0_g1_i1.p1 TRINITY_DN31075_c0_g1~~TRINITY_DN31075_c0_g1_i1.p1  ORF type:complete len:549 (+),score=80.25 TRINITY_DN31075_c0_g1_i1:95-1741(+)
MIDYRAGTWGFSVAFSHLRGSLVPKALAMAIPNCSLTFLMSTLLRSPDADDIDASVVTNFHEDTSADALTVISSFTTVMLFILYNRSRISYNRWWEGGTLLQKTRGEWFNAFSSVMAFTSTKPDLQPQVDAYTQLLARLMSLLMCCGLQQVSPNRDRPFEIIDLEGIDVGSMEFLNTAPDKVEVILQWIQRSMVLHMGTGVLPVAPPILSRAFQEVSRGIVNLQNARKVADFPYPYPLAQISMILQILHWAMFPVAAALAMPRMWATMFSFFSIFVLWCIHFNAIELEFPFGSKANDLPMEEFQLEWNHSICTLLDKRACCPPDFSYDPLVHDKMSFAMSDASDLYIPILPVKDKGNAKIQISSRKHRRIRDDMTKAKRRSVLIDPDELIRAAEAVSTEEAKTSSSPPSGSASSSAEGADANNGATKPGFASEGADVPADEPPSVPLQTRDILLRKPGSSQTPAQVNDATPSFPSSAPTLRERLPPDSSSSGIGRNGSSGVPSYAIGSTDLRAQCIGGGMEVHAPSATADTASTTEHQGVGDAARHGG